MADIDIDIKGIAIFYKKMVQGKFVWRIIFPFNDCHSVKLFYDKGAGKVFVGHLGKAKGNAEIVLQEGIGQATSTNDFNNKVLDLTVDSTLRTHSRLALKPKSDERSIILTIPSTNFDVKNTLRDFQDNLPLIISLFNPENGSEQILQHPGTAAPIINIAHSITGKVQMTAGTTLSVKTDGNTIFTTEPDTAYTLTFDNDCEKVTESSPNVFVNDMEMIYQVFEEPGHPNRKFLVRGSVVEAPAPLLDPLLVTEPPNLLRGKPCLAVKLTDQGTIDSLP